MTTDMLENPAVSLGGLCDLLQQRNPQAVMTPQALQQRLKEFAVARGVRGFVAEVLQANTAMLNLARRLGKIEVKSEDGSYHVTSIFA